MHCAFIRGYLPRYYQLNLGKLNRVISDSYFQQTHLVWSGLDLCILVDKRSSSVDGYALFIRLCEGRQNGIPH
jgi:hypothetical protein